MKVSTQNYGQLLYNHTIQILNDFVCYMLHVICYMLYDFMTDEKWQNIKGIVDEKFGISDLRTEKTEVGEDYQGKSVWGEIEILEFEGPLGKMRLERETKPAIIDKKIMASRRIGGERKVGYIYSEEEKVKTFKVYKWNEAGEEWEEIRQDFLTET